ncbi:MAG: hypothetical protein QGG23_04820 [Candidatus Bathyarchaeota archaeon]|nr:hypothetical protein [Candidatus Bathyarchaeota archaeon]MDP7443120.1 hypothetical protein [Candidatus Bathyarchaeota archaeon]
MNHPEWIVGIFFASGVISGAPEGLLFLGLGVGVDYGGIRVRLVAVEDEAVFK